MNPADEKLIAAWQQASLDLQIEIQTPFVVDKVSYPVFVKYFGRKKGTIVARHERFMDFLMPEDKDYFFSAVNADVYSEYNRETLLKHLRIGVTSGQRQQNHPGIKEVIISTKTEIGQTLMFG